MFWKHPITKKKQVSIGTMVLEYAYLVVHATDGIPSDFGHYLFKTSIHNVDAS